MPKFSDDTEESEYLHNSMMTCSTYTRRANLFQYLDARGITPAPLYFDGTSWRTLPQGYRSNKFLGVRDFQKPDNLRQLSLNAIKYVLISRFGKAYPVLGAGCNLALNLPLKQVQLSPTGQGIVEVNRIFNVDRVRAVLENGMMWPREMRPLFKFLPKDKFNVTTVDIDEDEDEPSPSVVTEKVFDRLINKVNDMTKQTEWKFTTSSYSAIDASRIGEELTDEYPLAFIQTGQEDGNMAMIHRGIIDKALICNIPQPDVEFEGSGKTRPHDHTLVFLKNRKQFSVIKSWVKQVKAARWPWNPVINGNHTYTVTLQEIKTS